MSKDHNEIDVRSYKLKHLIEGSEPADPNSWQEKHHTVTIITPSSNKNHSRDELFIDHQHVHPDNWNWIHNKNQLAFAQGSGKDYIGGHIYLEDDDQNGIGGIQRGADDEVEDVQLSLTHPTYTFDVSENAGAYFTTDGNEPKWDTSTQTWQNANWSQNALKFSYWTHYNDDLDVHEILTRFEDPAAILNPTWQPSVGTYTCTMDMTRKLTFTASDSANVPIGTKYPYKMACQFDILANTIEGGAMVTGSPDVASGGKVYALKGQIDNAFAVGDYKLFSDDEESVRLTTHGKKLVVNGNPVKRSFMSGNKLYWSKDEEDDSPDLPTKGFVEFSPDGTRIINSSHGWEGYRQFSNDSESDEPQVVPGCTCKSAPAPPAGNLTVTKLLLMNPYTKDTAGNDIEDVQRKAMEDFYKIIQYYMPADLLHTFIGPQVPDLGDIQGIADDAPDDNRQFYSDLAYPYLANALKSASQRDSVKKLNARRAQKLLKDKTAINSVFKRQSAALYAKQFGKKYTEMGDYQADQYQQTPAKEKYIKDKCEQWRQRAGKGLDDSDKSKVDQMVHQVRDKALSNKYWAFKMFYALISPGILNQLSAQALSQNATAISKEIQRYCSVLNILDPEGFFAKEFIEIVHLQQLAFMLPKHKDQGANFDDSSSAVERILNEFVTTYVNNTDPKIRERIQQINEGLRITTIHAMMLMLKSSTNSNTTRWATIVAKFELAAVQKWGRVVLTLADHVASGFVAFSMVQLMTGAVKWSDMTSSEQVGLISQSTKFIATFVRKGISARVQYEATYSLKEAFKVFVWKDVKVYSDQITSTLGKWVIGHADNVRIRPGFLEPGLNVIMEGGASFSELMPRLSKFLGKNMNEFFTTRFAGAMAIAGIVVSALGLADATTPLDKAMNSMFLFSSILDLVSSAVGLAVSVGLIEAGSLVVSAITSICGPLAIVGAIVGVILMLVEFFTTQSPPHPVDKFVGSNEVRSRGLYMEHETDIDYFQIVPDNKNDHRSSGITMTPSGQQSCLTVLPNGSLRLGRSNYSYETVLSLSVDYQGHFYILTKKITQSGHNFSSTTIALTNQTSGVTMNDTLSKTKAAQVWSATCTGNVTYQDPSQQTHVRSATFTIQNTENSLYLSVLPNGTIGLSHNSFSWILTMSGMKPDHLYCPNIQLKSFFRDKSFSQSLFQLGSPSNRSWSISPNLPNFLELNTKNGVISQKTGVAPNTGFHKTTFALTVSNDFGYTSATFSIEVVNT